jgi:hypothetical protein
MFVVIDEGTHFPGGNIKQMAKAISRVSNPAGKPGRTSFGQHNSQRLIRWR